MIQRFGINTAGRDFAVGDIHGHFSLLQRSLDDAGFNPDAGDRLFSVGDLVDRGPECEQCVEWLGKPWFHAVRGNHEDYVCRYQSCDRENWIRNGGSWFLGLHPDEQAQIADAVSAMPLAIEVETPGGLVGIVHADVPGFEWSSIAQGADSRKVRDFCMWSRGRIQSENDQGVAGVRAVIVGHTPLRRPAVLGNVYHIDTRGWIPQGGGYFTLLDLHTLEGTPAFSGELEFD